MVDSHVRVGKWIRYSVLAEMSFFCRSKFLDCVHNQREMVKKGANSYSQSPSFCGLEHAEGEGGGGGGGGKGE